MNSLKDILQIDSFDHNKEQTRYPRVSTGNFALDCWLGGGWPLTRIIEILGEQSSGKSFLAYVFAANATRAGHDVVLIDTEDAWPDDGRWLSLFGFDASKFYCLKATESRNITLEYIQNNIIKPLLNDKEREGHVILILDSLPMTPLQKQLSNDDVKLQVAERARFISNFFGSYNQTIKAHNITLVVLNQLRYVVTTDMFTKQTVHQKLLQSQESTGGVALKFAADLRIHLQTQSFIYDKEGDKDKQIVGQIVRASILKSKIGPAQKDVYLKLYTYNGLSKNIKVGVDKYSDVIPLLKLVGIVQQNGAWYTIEGIDKKLRQSDVMEYVEKNESELKEEIIKKLQECYQ